MRHPAPLILGGGPAGTAAAIALAEGGARPLLFERQRETGDALCGGFLSWATLARLERIGLDAGLLSGAPIARLRLFDRDRAGEAALPAPAMGLSRHRLDSLMLARAQQAGAAIERGQAGTIAADGAVRLGDGGVVTANAVFLATGKHDARGLSRPRAAIGNDPALGLRLRLGPAPALRRLVADAIELHLFDRCYVGINLHEDGSANLCLAARKSLLADHGGQPMALLSALAERSAALSDRLAYAGSASTCDAIAAIPYGWRAETTSPGLFRLGDQAAVIPSLAGEGIGIAIASGTAAARSWLTGGADAAPDYQASFAAATRQPVGLASLLYRLSEWPVSRRLAPAVARYLPDLAAVMAQRTRIPAATA